MERAPAKSAETSGAGRKVLLAEDNKVNQVLANKLLKNRGYDVVVVENGRQAIEAMKSEKFDAVLMDVQMPVLGGLEASREIRDWEENTGGHLPIIAMTANAMEGDREKCLDAGMDDYISKPINPTRLYECLEEYTKATPADEQTMKV